MDVYLVGGYVRDLLMDRTPGDRDFVFFGADLQRFKTLHPRAQVVGRFFPVALLNGEEFSPARGEDIRADLQARDFTINAAALPAHLQGDRYEPPSAWRDALIAHPYALQDMQGKVLRPCSPNSLADDPLRVFRAARFAAAFPDFDIAPELWSSMQATARAGRLNELIAERVGLETRKALASAQPGRFLRALAEADCLEPWFHELVGAADIPAGPLPYHDEDTLTHICEVMDRAAGDPLTVWMALCHDLGKLLTPADKHPKHHGHDHLGAAPAEALGRRLMLPDRYIRAGAMASREHMLAGRYNELRPGTKVDLLSRLHSVDLQDELFRLALADGDLDYRDEADSDMRTMLSVRLREEDRDRGAFSGLKLRLLRCEALKKRRRG